MHDVRTVLITGVAGGMGEATAVKLLGEGFHVIGLDIRRPGNDIPGLSFIKTDLTDMTSVGSAFSVLKSEGKSIDAIINMAGVYDLNSLVEISEEDFIRIFNVNLFSVYRVNKTFLPLLKKGGRVVITSSELAPLSPLPFTGLYGVTKSAVEKYALSLRKELTLLGYKVSVIRPGAVDTRFLGISTSKLDKFCEETELYSCNSARFREIVDKVEARKIPPERIADIAFKAVTSRRPRYIYKINRNPLLLLLNILPEKIQTAIICRLIRN